MAGSGSGSAVGSGSDSGSVSQRYGSADPNPCQNVTGLKVEVTNENLGRGLEKMANVRFGSRTMEVDVHKRHK
jgi:hypothetical protein